MLFDEPGERAASAAECDRQPEVALKMSQGRLSRQLFVENPKLISEGRLVRQVGRNIPASAEATAATDCELDAAGQPVSVLSRCDLGVLVSITSQRKRASVPSDTDLNTHSGSRSSR